MMFVTSFAYKIPTPLGMDVHRMERREYTAEDLALDAQFQQWMHMPPEELHTVWRALPQAHTTPEMADRAAVLIRQAGLTEDTEANAAFLHVWNNIRTQIEETSQRSL